MLAKADTAYTRNQPIHDTVMGWRFPNKKLLGEIGEHSMGETADNIAADIDVSREDSDAFALGSQKKYAAAKAVAFFDDEITPVETLAARRKDPLVMVTADEHPRPDTTLEKLASLKPLFTNGVVTAGNASGINDGAAALLLGPVPASRKALERAGLTLEDIDVIEINEVFAPQVLGCLKELGLAFDDPRVNPNGGAIAIGHPLGASGAHLVLTAMRQLERSGGRYALVTLCIGIGQGIAIVLERPTGC